MPEKTSVILNTAADLIEERGWLKGSGWHSGDAGLCLEGALMAASGLSRNNPPEFRAFYESCPAYNAVAAYLERDPRPRLGPVSDALWQWNDTKGRTASEVIEVLRAAAVIEAVREERAAAWETYAEVVTS